MILSYNWLKELINIDVTPEKLVEEMSLYSVEVETWKKMVSATNLTIGHVLEVKNHENSDHLHVCKVDLGNKIEQIVCGAPNISEGQNVIVALPGAVLPGGTIKESVVRGVSSNGMICSLQELGIENKYVPAIYQNGIYVLGDDAVAGDDPLKYLCLDDYQIELALTPNRLDLMSMLGVAHDMKAMYNKEINYPKAILHETNDNTSDEISVKIDTPKCLSYYARIVKDVTIKESPAFIKARLIAAGVRPINNVVDITNYILMLFGQPLHSFDKDKLGKEITVRCAKKDEKLITLDDQERDLIESDIVITDELDNNRVVCLAGVMGGKSTEVDENTKNIVLESAVFDGLSIRKTSQRLALRSESSSRYERGVDLNNSLNAVDYACYLLEKYADGKVSKSYVHAGIEHIDDTLIEINEEKVKSYLGINIPLSKIKDICESLDFKVEEKNINLLVFVPNRRMDVKIKQDLIEEIARINGYDKLNETLPLVSTVGGLTHAQKIRTLINKTLIGLGLNECVTYSLVNSKLSKLCNDLYTDDCKPIVLLHPMTEEHSIMRRSLVPSLLDVLKYNNARKITDLSFFEIGKKYYLINDEPVEKFMLAGVMQGNHHNLMWRNEFDNIDFYYVKGILDALFEKLELNVSYKTCENPSNSMHPGRTAYIYLNDTLIGYVGEIHPLLAKELDIYDTYAFEIELEPIFDITNPVVLYKQISKVPSVDRDLALVMDAKQEVGEVIDAIYKADKNMIKNVNVFDIYEGSNIEEGKKSVAVRITLESTDTLTEDVINQKMKRILNSLNYLYHIELRQ